MAVEITNTIAGKLQKIGEIKTKIATAVNTQGGSISDSTPFAEYPEIIEKLKPTGKLGVCKVTENNRTYRPEDDGVAAFSEVQVNISSGSGSGSGSGGSGGYDSGVNGYDEDGTSKNPLFTVTYLNNDTEKSVFATEEVEYKGNGILKDKPENMAVSEADRFKYQFIKWNPPAQNVQSNISCTPIFRDTTEPIQEEWSEIAANPDLYSIGSIKILETGNIAYNESEFPIYAYNTLLPAQYRLRVTMELVMKGEDGTSMTWLAKDLISWIVSDSDAKPIYCAMNGLSYRDSKLKKWIDGKLYNALDEDLRSVIVPVEKKSSGFVNGFYKRNAYSDTCSLWIPGYTEVRGDSATFEDGVVYSCSDRLEGDVRAGYFTRSGVNAQEGFFRTWDSYRGWATTWCDDTFFYAPGNEANRFFTPRIGFCI